MDSNQKGEQEVVVEIQKQQKYPVLDYNINLQNQHIQNINALNQNVNNLKQQNEQLEYVKKQNLINQQQQQQFVNQQPLNLNSNDTEVKFSLQTCLLKQDQNNSKITDDLIDKGIKDPSDSMKNCCYLAMMLREFYKLNGCHFIFKEKSENLNTENACLFLLFSGIHSDINQAYYAQFSKLPIDFSTISQKDLNKFCVEFTNLAASALQIPNSNIEIFRVLKDLKTQDTVIQFDYKKQSQSQKLQLDNDIAKLADSLKKIDKTVSVTRKNVIKDFVFTTDSYFNKQTLQYKPEYFKHKYEERGIINGMKQIYAIPLNWTGFGINVASFSEDASWLGSDTSEKVWPVGFVPGRILGREREVEYDFLKDVDLNTNKQIEMGELIYRNPEELEKHCHSFIVNNNTYILAFQCRFDKTFLSIPSKKSNDYYVCHFARAMRPYRVLLKNVSKK